MKPDMFKTLALYKVEYPDSSITEIAKKFRVKYHQARYAIDKYASDTEFLSMNKVSKIRASKLVAEHYDDIQLLEKQFKTCISQLEVDEKMVLPHRVEFLSKIMRIKVQLTRIELEKHLKRADASIIASIVKRFMPEATNDDIIKIYNEEKNKMAADE